MRRVFNHHATTSGKGQKTHWSFKLGRLSLKARIEHWANFLIGRLSVIALNVFMLSVVALSKVAFTPNATDSILELSIPWLLGCMATSRIVITCWTAQGAKVCTVYLWDQIVTPSVILTLIHKTAIGFGPGIKNVATIVSEVSNSQLATTVSW